uniref:Melanoregulin n=1 Tax=Latimeria chalumnae TaxID=7897 RepID=H3AKI5_LATCH
MAFKAWIYQFCCCVAEKPPEKDPLIRWGQVYNSFGGSVRWDEERNLWSTPHDSSHTEADDDRELYNLIVTRDQLDQDSEEWQKLNYDIHALRQCRREVRNRWRKILEDLGFQKEADSLLSVTKLSTVGNSQNLNQTRELLLKLAEETSIFSNNGGLPERYLFVLDRLISLDAAEDFLKTASKRYPK